MSLLLLSSLQIPAHTQKLSQALGWQFGLCINVSLILSKLLAWYKGGEMSAFASQQLLLDHAYILLVRNDAFA